MPAASFDHLLAEIMLIIPSDLLIWSFFFDRRRMASIIIAPDQLERSKQLNKPISSEKPNKNSQWRLGRESHAPGENVNMIENRRLTVEDYE